MAESGIDEVESHCICKIDDQISSDSARQLRNPKALACLLAVVTSLYRRKSYLKPDYDDWLDPIQLAMAKSIPRNATSRSERFVLTFGSGGARGVLSTVIRALPGEPSYMTLLGRCRYLHSGYRKLVIDQQKLPQLC